MVRYLIAWFPMLVIAVLNGALRDLTYGKRISELHAHQISTLTGMVVIGLFIWAVVRLWPPVSESKALDIGMSWLALTVVFEFVFGHYAAHRSWALLVRDYDLVHGRVWLVFLAWLTLAPYVFYRLRRRA